MPAQSENITEPLKATHQTSYFRIFAASIFIGPPFVIGMCWLANTVLPEADATTFKTPLLGMWALIGSSSGIATLIGGIKRTFAKVDYQSAQAAGASTPALDLLQQVVNYAGATPFVSAGLAGVPAVAAVAPLPNSPLSVITDPTDEDDNDGHGPQDD